MKQEYDPDLERLYNLLFFNINFTKYVSGEELFKQSPCYILEKYNHWIGFHNEISVTDIPDCMVDFMKTYRTIWGSSTDLVIPQLVYLTLTDNLNMMTMVTFFEKYIGPLYKISPLEKFGLHPNLYSMVGNIVEKNDHNIKLILRDMKLGELINEQAEVLNI